MRVLRRIHGLALLALATAVSPGLRAAPQIYMVHEDRIVLRVRIPGVLGGSDLPQEILLSGEQAQRVTQDVAWPSAESPSRLALETRRLPSPQGSPQRVHLSAVLETPGRAPVRTARDLSFFDTTLAFFEVGRDGPSALTLAVEAVHTSEDVPSARPVVGAAVVLALEIQSLEQGRAVSLETNRLQTFLGESVGYSFHYGQGDETVSLEIRLRPLALTDEVARVEIELSGRLGSLLVSRREQWVTTRNATSSLDIVEGEPPAGFRFLVTPRF